MIFCNNPKIKFYCDSRKTGVIPEPYQSRKVMPDWYKKLSSYANREDGMEIPTLKRCPPFLDAMSTGWIIPLAADITVKVIDNGAGVNWETNFFEPIFEHHNLIQISTHPNAPTVPIKVMNHWLIQTPPGWSCLFVPPLNRPDDTFDLFSGIVETDKYFEYINFPGFLKAREGTFTIKRGHPLMQVIPFKRDFSKEEVIKTLNSDELQKLQHTRDRKSSWFSLYRDSMWEKK
jgi:Family of unknown function (DUF6065)